MRILITGAGGAAAISVWKSLSPQHELHMADIDACAAGLYLVPEHQRILLPRGDAPNYIDEVLKICEHRKIDLLIPTVDTELYPLASATDKFSQIATQLLLSSPNVLQTCRDKYHLLRLCQGKIPTPKFDVLLENQDISLLGDFPLFAKPRFGSGASGIYVINTPQDLAQIPKDGSYLIQEFLPGEEYSLDTYTDANGNTIAMVPRLRMKIDSGIAVAARTVYSPDLVKMGIETIKHIGIRYVANIQFKQAKDGQFKLLEINPRFPGTLPLTAAAGVDIPQLLIKEALGENLPKDLMPYKELAVVRYWAEHFFDFSEWNNLCKKQ